MGSGCKGGVALGELPSGVIGEIGDGIDISDACESCVCSRGLEDDDDGL